MVGWKRYWKQNISQLSLALSGHNLVIQKKKKWRLASFTVRKHLSELQKALQIASLPMLCSHLQLVKMTMCSHVSIAVGWGSELLHTQKKSTAQVSSVCVFSLDLKCSCATEEVWLDLKHVHPVCQTGQLDNIIFKLIFVHKQIHHPVLSCVLLSSNAFCCDRSAHS